MFALGFYLVVLDPPQAVAIVALMSVLAGVPGAWLVRAEITARPKRTLRFVLPGLLGVPVGVGLLAFIDAGVLRVTIAVILISYGVFFGFRKALPSFSRRTPVLDAGIGLTGGVLGGAASVSGAVPAMWLSVRPWAKAETRAVLQPFNMAILSTTVVLLAWQGAFTAAALTALLVTVPIGLAAAQLGIATFRRLTDAGFRRAVILLSLMMGVGILASEWL